MTQSPQADLDHGDGKGPGGRIVLLALVAGAAGLIVLRRRSAAKRKRKERARDARLRLHGIDVERAKRLRKGLGRASTQVALSQRRLKHSLTGD
ncbi:hypothetical protein ACFJGV_17720 [Cnuibacter sp. UC19_7]|uniref:hypothetical protein n=1 Tax=Cnuibacter sp. UC19_7 TaxID=3350166 RepID=UPI00366F39D4